MRARERSAAKARELMNPVARRWRRGRSLIVLEERILGETGRRRVVLQKLGDPIRAVVARGRHQISPERMRADAGHFLDRILTCELSLRI